MSNTFLTPKVYANTALKLLKNNLVMARLVSGEFKDQFVKGGGTKTWAKRPPQFTVRDGAVASVQDVVEGEIEIEINKQKGVDVQFTSMEETLSVSALLRSTVMANAMSRLANQIDTDIHAETKKFYNWVGTPGEIINSFADMSKAPQRLDESGVEVAGRKGVLHPESAWALQGNLTTLHGDSVVKDALMAAKLNMNLGGIDWYSTQLAGSVTTGTRDGNALVDGASQNVTYASVKDGNWTQTLAIDNVGNAKTVTAGEVFTIADVYAINPITKTSLSYLQQFTVITGGTSATTATGNDQDLSLTISPPIITSGPFQTVSAAPADNAAIQWMGSDTETATDATTYNYGTVFRKEASALVSAKLIKPYSGESDYATDPDTGLTIRYWRTSDGTNDTHLHRFDVIYGVKNVDPRRGVRLSGTGA
jgi:hypothetical protein